MVGNDSANIKSEELLQEQAYFDVAAEQRATALEMLDRVVPEGRLGPGPPLADHLDRLVNGPGHGPPTPSGA